MVEFPLEDNILEVVRSRQRDVRYGVLPKTVQAGLPISVAEQTVRRYMARMWQKGRLYRFGGTGARRGYRCLKRAEQTIEDAVLALLSKNPWGLVSELVAQELEVSVDSVEAYLPHMEERGLLFLYRGCWKLPSKIQKLCFETCGHFGYRAA